MTIIRNVGILAHVDAGKTTLTEQLLHAAGAIATPGSVDRGTAVTDALAVERERGISVRLATASLDWRGGKINLVDTPGHVDFCAEVERSLPVLDGAVVVLSAVEGVQSHTSTIVQALQAARVPTLFFINKLDRLGADADAVLAEMRRELTTNLVPLHRAVDAGEANAGFAPIWPEGDEAIIEAVAETDDALLAGYLDGIAPARAELDQALARATASGRLHPVLMGVAKHGRGIVELLDAMTAYLPAAARLPEADLSALVYRIDHHPGLGRTAGVRVFAGSLAVRDSVENISRGTTETVSQLKTVRTRKLEDLRTLSAGDIGVVCGLGQARVGDILGSPASVPAPSPLAAALLTVMVSPDDPAHFTRLAEALQILCDEDPVLDLEYLPEQQELHVRITGWIQIEVLTATLRERFDLDVVFDSPTIIYKETPSAAGFGEDRYLMPKPCWAVVKFAIEPGPRGSGVTYESRVGVNDIGQKYQNEVAETIDRALRQGPKGWEVTDLRLILVEGEDHPIHSRPGNFKLATPMAIMSGLASVGTSLLEPILEFRVTAALELLGSITSDLSQRRATLAGPDVQGERFELTGRIPAATSLDYPVALASRSGGKAKIFTRLVGYEPCPDELGRTTPYRGISPLDRSKYILAGRGGMTGHR